ncbi:MAG TPA: OsmC family protein [Solirubrobacterales bacterium]|jgi:putative redox protein
MSFTARARRVGDALQQEIDVNGRHTIVTDEPEPLGGTDAGPAPHELLPASLAGCIGTMISRFAQVRGWPLGELVVDVDYDAESVPRRVEVAVRISGDLSDDQIERLKRVAKTCPVRRALESDFEFDERFTVLPLAEPMRAD